MILKTRKVWRRLNIIVALVTLACGLNAQNIMVNGSFEDGLDSNGPIGWPGSTNVGLLLGDSNAADGRDYAILYGRLFQTLTTQPGQAYEVRFAVSGNSAFPGISTMGLTWGGQFIGNTIWTSPDTTGNGDNKDWVYGDYTLFADSTSTIISFEGTGTSWKPSLDDVSVVPVPEPNLFGAGAICLLGLLATSKISRRWCRRTDAMR